MLLSLDELVGYGIRATDDSLGQVKDILFDDKAWVVRYLVADTGNWLPGRRVLIVPSAFGHPEWETRSFPVDLTCRQVEESPEIRENQPVSAQHEIDLHRHYAWDPYWLAYTGYEGPLAFPPSYPPLEGEETVAPARERGDPHLRSAKEVEGYHVVATDGEIGHVEDFVLEEDGWIVRYVVVSTRSWLPGRKVMLSPEWFDAVSWMDRKVFVDVNREAVRNSPAYDPERPVNREDEEVLYDYYGRPAYWKLVEERTAGIPRYW